jgi:sugar-specific transcriptional regulator TrmB
LTQEWMLKNLINLGFKPKDAQVYVYLALSGPKMAKDIASSLKINKRQVYRSLKRLQEKETVNKKNPAVFCALSFDKVLELFANANLKEAKRIENNKESVLSLWKLNLKSKSPQ